jgi:hypothetical protein
MMSPDCPLSLDLNVLDLIRNATFLKCHQEAGD